MRCGSHFFTYEGRALSGGRLHSPRGRGRGGTGSRSLCAAAQAPGPGRTLTCAAPRKASQEKPVLLGLARHPERAVLGKLAVALEVHEVYQELAGSWGRKAVRCQQRDPRPRAGRWRFRDGWRACVDPASRVGTVTDDVCGCRTGRGNPLPRVLLP